MRFHRNLLSFLAAWVATVGVAFFLPNLKTFGAGLQTCNACSECGQYYYASIAAAGGGFYNYGYFESDGSSTTQAFLGGACGACNGGDLYQEDSCTSSCNTYGSATINVKSYNFPNWTCNLPAGANVCVRSFNGGTFTKNVGSVSQTICTEGGGGY
jgi:hypothetical protein